MFGIFIIVHFHLWIIVYRWWLIDNKKYSKMICNSRFMWRNPRYSIVQTFEIHAILYFSERIWVLFYYVLKIVAGRTYHENWWYVHTAFYHCFKLGYNLTSLYHQNELINLFSGKFHSRDLLYGRFFCIGCSKSYKHKRHLSSHIRYECGKEPTFECQACSKKFFQKYTLNAHLRQMHNMNLI